tara:strand:- start:8062 stop:8571 length:510 start_codon:yes stop_codon:yes gene_type:complete
MRNIFVSFMILSLSFAGPTKKIYTLKGMMCGFGCVSTINNTIQSLDGVDNVKVDFETKSMEVTFDNNHIKSDDIVKSLPNPYKATLIKEVVFKEYTVGGMTCMGCVTNIRNSIDGIEGLENYDIDINEEKLYIEFDVSKVEEEKILSQIPDKFKIVEIIKVIEEETSKN